MPSGPHTKTASMPSRSTQRASSASALVAVDAPVQQVDVLRFARKHVDEVEARQEAVLQPGQLLLEHHGPRRAVAVEQRESLAASVESTVFTIDSSGVMPLPAAKPT